MGQTVATTRYFTRSLSAAFEQRAGLAVACVMGWQAVGGVVSPWVTGSSRQGLHLLELCGRCCSMCVSSGQVTSRGLAMGLGLS